MRVCDSPKREGSNRLEGAAGVGFIPPDRGRRAYFCRWVYRRGNSSTMNHITTGRGKKRKRRGIFRAKGQVRGQMRLMGTVGLLRQFKFEKMQEGTIHYKAYLSILTIPYEESGKGGTSSTRSPCYSR